MVVLLVLAILLAIAIPTFLGTTAAADNRSAQSNLITAFTDAKTQFQYGGQSYYVDGRMDRRHSPVFSTQPSSHLKFRAGSLGPSTSQGSSDSLSTISVAVSADGNGWCWPPTPSRATASTSSTIRRTLRRFERRRPTPVRRP